MSQSTDILPERNVTTAADRPAARRHHTRRSVPESEREATG